MRIGLANRLALIFSLLVLVATATVGYFVYRGARVSLIDASTERLADTADIVGGQLRDQVEAVGEDLRIMAQAPAVAGLARLADARRRGLTLDPETAMSDAEWREQLADVFLSFLDNRPSYQNVRLVALGDGGRELGRADRRGADVVWARRADLVSLAETPLVQEGGRLPRGTLYLSEISLRASHPDSAEVPTLRVGLPVYGAAGAPFGLLAIDLDMREVFARLESLLTRNKALYIANERGELLVRPQAPWSAAAGAPREARLPVIFPETQAIFGGTERFLRIEQARGAGDAVVSAYFGRLDFDGSAQRGELVVGITSPHQVILGGVRQVRTRSFFITLLFGLSGILFALAFARHLTRPLRGITRAISSFGHGAWAEELPVDRRDEIGMLARTFVEMAGEIERQVIELEQKERRQRTVLETAAEGILVTDAEGRIETFNPVAEHLLGYAADEVIGRKADTLIQPADRLGAEADGWPALRSGDEAIGRCKDGGAVPLSVSWNTFELGGQTRLTLFLQDISERKSAEAMREQLLDELRR